VGVICVIAGDIRTLSAGANWGQIGLLFANVRRRFLATKSDKKSAKNACAAGLILVKRRRSGRWRSAANTGEQSLMISGCQPHPMALRAMFGQDAHKLQSPQDQPNIRLSLHDERYGLCRLCPGRNTQSARRHATVLRLAVRSDDFTFALA
jgi:hypothetical protein